MRRSVVLIAIILAVCVCNVLPTADALECYKCKSTENSNCGKAPVEGCNEIAKEECSGQMSQCNEIVEMKSGNNGGYIVSRGCHRDTSCKRSINPNIIRCHTCDGDLCNNGLIQPQKTNH